MSRVTAGISGARRNAAAAVAIDGRLAAVCEQERLTRVREVGILGGGFPSEALEAALRIAGGTRREGLTYAIAEPGISIPDGTAARCLDEHAAHAATAFYTSGLDDAVIVVCDRRHDPEISVWRGRAGAIVREDWAWRGPGLASVYSAMTEAIGFAADRDEYRFEALARVGSGEDADGVKALIGCAGHELIVDPRLNDHVARWIEQHGGGGTAAAALVASSVQRHLGELLVGILTDVRRHAGSRNLCVGGGLFYNTYFNTIAHEAGLFDRLFVPINPGNAGLAVGCALAVSRASDEAAEEASPFLGPEYSAEEIKHVFDNCKLSYEYCDQDRLTTRTIEALASGQLVGWFQGRMEWGPRALGNRSILANPTAPYVLENLNVFLKRREPYRTFGVSICSEDLATYFEGPSSSRFMQFEYRLKDPSVFRHLMPSGAVRLRVHTVDEDASALRRLLKAFGSKTGVPVLVNTSFNGFHEPIVCSPRDAVRVFYGTGLDMLAIGNFLLRK